MPPQSRNWAKMTVCAAHRFIFCKGVFNKELQNDTSVIFRPLCRVAIYFSLAHTYVSSFGLSISWQTQWNLKLSNRFGIIDCENRNLVHSNEGIPCNNQGSLIKFYEKMPACTFLPTCNLLAKAADICATITISIC